MTTNLHDNYNYYRNKNRNHSKLTFICKFSDSIALVNVDDDYYFNFFPAQNPEQRRKKNNIRGNGIMNHKRFIIIAYMRCSICVRVHVLCSRALVFDLQASRKHSARQITEWMANHSHKTKFFLILY